MRLFLHLLLTANHRKKRWRGVTISRGQVLTSRCALAKTLTLSPRQIRTALNRLKSTSEVAIKTTNSYSIITICNYDKFQLDEIENDQRNARDASSERPASDQRPTTTKNDKNEKNDKNNKKYNPSDTSASLHWLDDELWAEWIQHKKKVRAAITPRAIQANIKKLESLGTHKANEIIEQSLSHGWKGLFDLHGQRSLSKREEANRRAYAILEGGSDE